MAGKLSVSLSDLPGFPFRFHPIQFPTLELTTKTSKLPYWKNEPMNVSEIFAQFAFWGSMACLPGFIYFVIRGFCVPTHPKALLALGVSAVALTHFLWYFRFLGEALGNKVGSPTIPVWHTYFPHALLGAGGLFIVRCIFKNLWNKSRMSGDP
ncbi:MAG: hypothetical protein QM627_13120 [Luteolibacter sp.]